MGGERNTLEALFFPISLIFVIIKSPLSTHKYAQKTHTHTPLFSLRKDSTFHCFHGAKTPGSVIKNMSFPIGLSPPFNYSALVPDYPIFSSLSITLSLERFGGGGVVVTGEVWRVTGCERETHWASPFITSVKNLFGISAPPPLLPLLHPLLPQAPNDC